MEPYHYHYRFNLRAWLMTLPVKKRKEKLETIIERSGQSKHTIRRIMYMRLSDTTYVRAETKNVICEVFGKDLADLENRFNPVSKDITNVL